MTDELERPVEAETESSAADPGGDHPAADANISDAAGSDAAPAEAPPVDPASPGDTSLLALIDRLGGLLERSDLSELEVEVGGTAVILRKPLAVAQTAPVEATSAPVPASAPLVAPAAEPGAAPSRPSIKAPLTGIWYASPAPGSAPFVEVGREVLVGQVVGLIEAMKLFNEIKSELAGRVVRVVPDTGTLVKAKQPLIEVDPL